MKNTGVKLTNHYCTGDNPSFLFSVCVGLSQYLQPYFSTTIIKAALIIGRKKETYGLIKH